MFLQKDSMGKEENSNKASVYPKKKYRKWSKTLKLIKKQIKRREKLLTQEITDSLVFFTEKSLKEHGDVSSEEKKAIEDGVTCIGPLKNLEGTDIEDIKKKPKFNPSLTKLGVEAVYKSQQKPECNKNTRKR